MKLKVAGYAGLLTCVVAATGILAFSNSSFSDVELISLSLLALLTLGSVTLIAFSGKTA